MANLSQGSLRFLHLQRTDLLVPIHTRHQPLPLEMGFLRTLRYWQSFAIKSR